ncbi:hypothetical protein TD95_002795 [Thielaviopsis punctulata]|uniref:Uncharacterized protein n=1 Tax=Thielaviopsis punctulata TaxID=72032 RepID=A0A0F4ZIZ6_9PEZI|nr:hypothetical protein TD95_002795 [Thielaviopsis punctulata]
MVSIKNPNFKSRNRAVSVATKSRAQRQKSEAQRKSGISKDAIRRGARPGFRPTSGPGKELSKKQQKRRDRALARALKRKQEESGEVEMKDAAQVKTKEVKKSDDSMQVDDDAIN